MARYDEEQNAILTNNTIIPLEVLQENPEYVEKTVEELVEYYTKLEERASKKRRKEEILEELEQFDKTVDRQWEDYYIDNNKTPVERIAVVIKQKEELRAEYQTLEKELKEGEVVE
jgi:lipopolysaccharide biosynthesis regulator YciM